MRFTLKTKIWLTVLTIVLLFSFFSLYYFPAQQEKLMKKNFDSEAQNLANTIALGVQIALKYEDYDAVRIAMSFVKDDPRFVFVNLRKFDTVWTNNHTQYSIHNTILKTFPEDLNLEESSHAKLLRDTIIKVSAFAANSNSWAIELSFSTTSIVSGKKQIRTTSLIASTVVFIIGIIIGFWLSRNISIPILALRNAANKVGEGDLTQRVISKSGDEIGDLTRAFNKMVEDLAKAREELSTAYTKLASTNQALRATVADLKAAQEQLIQSEKMASLGQLTAGIAHELNNPINFVKANIQPLKNDLTDVLSIVGRYEKVIHENNLKEKFDSVRAFKEELKIDLAMKEVNDLLKGIEDGALRTSEIVKGLRNFSRLDQNEFKKANLNEGLESTLTLLHGLYKNRIEIIKDFGTIPEIDCFPGQINQVFVNILSNAIQAINGEGSIFIKTFQVGELVKVSIKDTGTGMTDEVRKKIFDPFFTTKDVGKGTGLGLSISFGIIQKHNGEIEVFTAPGKGTEFLITIPIKQRLTE